MMGMKSWVALCLAAAALVAPIRADQGNLRIGTEPVVAMDCKPILICEGLTLLGYSWEVCVKIRITDC